MASARVEAERLFIGAGCNRIVNNVSWGPSGLVAFGAHSAVAIFCPKSAQILTTLPGHKGVVNCTYWLPSCKDAYKVENVENHFLLSGSADGTISIRGFQVRERKWSGAFQVPEAHKKSVTCLTGIFISQSVALFASASSDGIVYLWEVIIPSSFDDDCKITVLESLSVGPKPMVALSLAELPGDPGHIILAMGGLDNKIHIYSGDKTGKLALACQLKGHTDWIRSLDFSIPSWSDDEKNTLFLVSASQDRTIRIWKMALHISSANTEVPYRKGDTSLMSYIEGPIFMAGPNAYQVSLESLLVGHEDWVYSVEWQPPLPSRNGNVYQQPMSILSASMDKKMMIWRPEKTTGIWINEVTVGELSHSALGFYGAHWAPDGDSILANGYGGSFHLWKNTGVDYENWEPQSVPSGHFSAVSDIAWSRSGEYLLSVSHDQTSRIFAPWRSKTHIGNKIVWHEIAHPQVHGHDINCVVIIKGKGNHRFVSGADEKVARVFEAPLSFLKTLNHAILEETSNSGDLHEHVQILGANMSALGLSQKPIYVNASNETSRMVHNDATDSLETIPDAVPVVLTVPPVEEQLAWHTLWPESHKLYGHGNELFSLCCDHEGKLVASSCKAQSPSVAEIWLWEVGSWKAVGRLQSHSLTVTQLEFSYDDSFLLAVSRDRQFSLFSIIKSGENVSYQLVAKHEAHKRIIWACSWNPFGNEFATGSRDKTVKIWTILGDSSVKQLVTLPPFRDSVTALSWTGCNRSKNSGLLAIGMDNGLIELWHLSGGRIPDGQTELAPFIAEPAMRFDPFLCHVSTVHRLAWRSPDTDDSKTMQLASCGADHCVRVFEVVYI